MDTTTRTGSPLRQRMIEDMRMRKLEARTQEGHIRAFRKCHRPAYWSHGVIGV